jgi:hypothetical protein
VGKLQYRAAGQPNKSGKILNFPSLSIPLRLPDDMLEVGGTSTALANQTLWIEIGVPTIRDSNNQTDESKVFDLRDKVQGGYGYALIAGGSITEWGNPARRQVRVSFGGLQVSPKPLANLNRVTLHGQIIEEGKNYIVVEDRYNVKGDWRSRNIPVVYGGSLPSLKRQSVLVYGRMAGKSYTGEPEIYVISDPNEIFVV